MYISKIHIENFKCFKETTINFDPDINVIIGRNNAGKSTMFEAIRLWSLAFSQFLKERTHNSSPSSFYSTESFSFTLVDVSFLRISDFESLFNSKKNHTSYISIFLKNDKAEVELPIEFTKTTEGHNLRFSLCKFHSSTKSKRIDASRKILEMINKPEGSSLRELFFCTYLYPLFMLPINEPEYGEGYVKNCLHVANAEKVLRNLLNVQSLPLVKSRNRYNSNQYITKIQDSLHQIIKEHSRTVDEVPFLSFFLKQKKGDGPFVNVVAENEKKECVELAQLGSGTINLINILATLEYGEYKKYHLSLLLLDEPDSHLHANHQRQLFEYLKEVSKNTNKQIIIITHNHELIDNFEKVVYIDSSCRDKDIFPVNREEYLTIYENIAPEYHKKMLEICDVQKSLCDMEKQLKQLNKPIVLVEGDSDVSILKRAFSLLYEKEEFFDGSVEIISCPNSVSGIKQFITSGIKENLFGIVDNDPEGIGPYEELRKDSSFEEKDGVLCKKKKSVFFMKLPVPTFRSSQGDFFNSNTFIEYLFTDEVLERNKVELESSKGTNFRTIKGHFLSVIQPRNKELKSEVQSQKDIFHKNISNLKKDDVSEFRKIFETIATLFNLELT